MSMLIPRCLSSLTRSTRNYCINCRTSPTTVTSFIHPRLTRAVSTQNADNDSKPRIKDTPQISPPLPSTISSTSRSSPSPISTPASTSSKSSGPAPSEELPPQAPIFTAQEELGALYLDHEFLAHKHHFDTFRLVKSLEALGFSRGQAETTMRGVQGFLRQNAVRMKKEILSRSDIENEAYLFRAALTELRTEIQIMRRQNLAALQSGTATTIRELDSLSTRLREDVAVMKNDIQLDTNMRKTETTEELKAIDIRIQEVNNRLTIALGDLRTEMEGMKWEMTRRSLLTIFASASTILLFGYFLFSTRPSSSISTAEKDQEMMLTG